jgi:hypothetical protein
MYTDVRLSGEARNVWPFCGLILASPEVDNDCCGGDDDDDDDEEEEEEEVEGETPKGKREKRGVVYLE